MRVSILHAQCHYILADLGTTSHLPAITMSNVQAFGHPCCNTIFGHYSGRVHHISTAAKPLSLFTVTASCWRLSICSLITHLCGASLSVYGKSRHNHALLYLGASKILEDNVL